MIAPNPFRLVAALWRSLWWKLRGYDMLATEEEQESRWTHCLPCRHRVGQQCAICTCFLEPKIMLTSEECPYPMNKWGRIARRSSTI